MELGNQRRIWDREYKKRGRLWRGSSIDSIDDEILVPALNNGCGNGKDVNKIDGVLGLDFSINALKLYKLKTKMLYVVTCWFSHLRIESSEVYYFCILWIIYSKKREIGL
jgi:hypothetical protein